MAFNGLPVLKFGATQQPACFHGIRQATTAHCECSCQTAKTLGAARDSADGLAELHDGRLKVHTIDLEIPSRGFHWKLERTYRSSIDFDGPLGRNWEFNYNRRLLVGQNSVMRVDGYDRADPYELSNGTFRSPSGFYTELIRRVDGTFVERDRARTQVLYSEPDDAGFSRMTEIQDRNGNKMRFVYNSEGQLTSVVDTLGRPITYIYDTSGRLVEVLDFIGRTIRLSYTDKGHLRSVSSPLVQGTPTRNDFSNGKTTLYDYTSGFDNDQLNHLLIAITAPNEAASGGPPQLRVEYDTAATSPDIGRVLRLTLGGVNENEVPAGGSISYAYSLLSSALPGDLRKAVFQNTVEDRNGNRTEYRFNQFGNPVRIRNFSNRRIRTEDQDAFETNFEYNRDGETTRVVYPEGNSIEYSYDDQNKDRLQQGNLLAETRRSDPRRGGDQHFLKTTYTYEPVYNQRRTVTDPRGNDPSFTPQNGGTATAERYTSLALFDYQASADTDGLAKGLSLTNEELKILLNEADIPLGLGDINGGGHSDQVSGNVLKIIRPTVTLSKDSKMAAIEAGVQQRVEEPIPIMRRDR
jgi:YD repeat-containing protein